MKKFTSDGLSEENQKSESDLLKIIKESIRISFDGEIDSVLDKNIEVANLDVLERRINDLIESRISESNKALMEEVYYNGFEKIYERFNK